MRHFGVRSYRSTRSDFQIERGRYPFTTLVAWTVGPLIGFTLVMGLAIMPYFRMIHAWAPFHAQAMSASAKEKVITVDFVRMSKLP